MTTKKRIAPNKNQSYHQTNQWFLFIYRAIQRQPQIRWQLHCKYYMYTTCSVKSSWNWKDSNGDILCFSWEQKKKKKNLSLLFRILFELWPLHILPWRYKQKCYYVIELNAYEDNCLQNERWRNSNNELKTSLCLVPVGS